MAPISSMPPAPGATNVLVLTKIPDGATDQQLKSACGAQNSVLDVEYRPADPDGLGWAFIVFTTTELAKGAKERIHGKPLPPLPPGQPGVNSPQALDAALGEGLFGAMKTDHREQLWKEARSAQGQVYYYHAVTRKTQWVKPPQEYGPSLPPPPPGGRPGLGMPPMMPGLPQRGMPGMPMSPVADAQAAIKAAQHMSQANQDQLNDRTGAGPVGANLFVYHIPNSWDDAILRQHFEHFGGIVSCRVQRDPDGRAKGYGFVSYDAPGSASAAIAGMHGFPVEGKWLKVQLKKGDEQSIRGEPGAPQPSGPLPGLLGDVMPGQQPPRPPAPMGMGGNDWMPPPPPSADNWGFVPPAAAAGAALAIRPPPPAQSFGQFGAYRPY